jgi:hypothetical protein
MVKITILCLGVLLLAPHLGCSLQSLDMRDIRDDRKADNVTQEIYICSDKIVSDLLNNPQLSPADKEWCAWALSSTGGKVKPGHSWGKLKTKEREKYTNLICNAAAVGVPQSCDSIWGEVSFLQ